MSAIDVVIHGTGTGVCSLSGKDGDGLTMSFKEGTIAEGFLAYKSFLSLVKMKFARQAQNGKAEEPRPKEVKAETKPALPAAIPMTVKAQ